MMKYALLLTLVLTASLSALTEREAIEKTVADYNEGVIQAVKTGNVHHIKPITTEKVSMKLFIWIKSWHENNLFMDAKLEKLLFTEEKIGTEKATLVTDEVWRYRYINIVSKTVVHPPTKISYTVQYGLFKKEGRWIIEEIKVLSEKQVPL